MTSANRSGGQETLDDAAARAALGDLVDLYVVGQCPGAVSSTTVDVTRAEAGPAAQRVHWTSGSKFEA